MKRWKILLNHTLSGTLYLDSTTGFHFIYHKNYLSNPNAIPLSIDFPLQADVFFTKDTFPLFAGLQPSHWWIKKIATKNQNDTENDINFNSTTLDTLGSIQIIPLTEDEKV
jgi:HipA-like protein